jgi:AcrR family transcriptional regulator
MDKASKTKNKILDAAIKVFATKGYHNARMDEIVEESNTSKGSIYFHFPSKEVIFFAVIEKFVNVLENNLNESLNEYEHGVEKVDAALRTCLNTFDKYRNLAKIFLVQAVGLGEAFEEKQMEIQDRFAKLIKKQLDEAVSEMDIPPIDTEVAANIWMGAINDVVIRWVRTGTPEPERAIPTLRTMLLRSIGVTEERIQSFENITREQIIQ